MKNKVIKAIKVLAVLAVAALVWQFGIKAQLPLYQSWSGTIEEPYRIRDLKNISTGAHQPERLLYDHYWRVDLGDGEIADLEMPYKLWQYGHAGARITKESGARYPEIVRGAPRKTPATPKVSSETSAPPEEKVQPSASVAETDASS